jgi:hypothetical protein
MENEEQVNIITTIDHIVNESNNTKDEMPIEPIGDIPVKIVYDSKWNNDYSTGYELRKESKYPILLNNSNNE